MNCYSCQELLITPRQRAADCKECIEQYLNDKFEISQENEVLVENNPCMIYRHLPSTHVLTHEIFCKF